MREPARAATITLTALEGEALASSSTAATAVLPEAAPSAGPAAEVLKCVVDLVRVFARVAASALTSLEAVALVVATRRGEASAAAFSSEVVHRGEGRSGENK